MYLYIFCSVLRVLCTAATLAFVSHQTVGLPSSRSCFGSKLSFLSNYFPHTRGRTMVSTIGLYSLRESPVAKPWHRWICPSHVLESCPHSCSLDFSQCPGASLSHVLSHPQARNRSGFALSKYCCFPLEYSWWQLDFFDHHMQFSYRTIFSWFSRNHQQGSTMIKSSWSEMYEMWFNNCFTRDVRKWPTLSVCWMRMEQSLSFALLSSV